MLFKGTKEYQAFKETIHERNKLASRIWVEQDRYQKALEVCNIDLTKLEGESKQHVTLERVKAYITETAKGRVIHRDLIAAHIFTDIKAHYRFLKEANIDVSHIKQNAKSHARRKLLSALNPQNRSYFKEVEAYRDANKAVITLGKEIQNASRQNVLISRNTLETLNKLTFERNALAYKIYTNESLYHAALNFYEVGTVVNTVSFEDALRHANARWYRLQQQAMQHVINQRVEHYQDALLAGDHVRRYEIAHHIMQDLKAHHSAILKHAPAANILWRAIRADSKAYAREKLIASLNLAEQADFKRVEAYLEEQQAIREMWQEVYAAKQLYLLPDEKINEYLMPFIHAHTPIRDELAAHLITDPLRYRTAFEFYNIRAEDLLKSAHMHHGRARVERYAQKRSRHVHTRHEFLERANIAYTICQHPKVHYAAIITNKVSWKVLYHDAKAFENYEAFNPLTPDEKKLYRLARRYQKVNRQVGRGWANLIASKKQGIRHFVYNTRKQALVALTAKRDYLAHQLLDQKETLKWQHAFKPAENINSDASAYDHLAFKWADVQKQAMRHSDKVEQVKLWQEADDKSYQGLQAINQHALVAKHPESYWDWLFEYEQVEEMGLPIVNNTASYRYALQSNGFTNPAKISDRTALKQKVKALLQKQDKVNRQKTFNDRALDQDQLKRIQLANKIAKQSQLVKGSIAERYLREHRGIQGSIPLTFRYHPRQYCSEAKRYLPALVVIAQNQAKQIQAVQVIYLDPLTANKAKLNQPKLTYGVLQNAAVIVNQGKLKNQIALAEGPETALSIKEANPDLTVYATLGASNFVHAPISHVSSILFCADNDGVNASSEKQLNEAAPHFAHKGISVYQAKPNYVGKKTDFNDVLTDQGKAAVRSYLDHAKLIKAPQTLEHIQTEIQNLTNKIIKVNASNLSQAPESKLLENKNESKSINWQTLVTESQPIAGTLAEQYFKEQCAIINELPRHVHYHSSVWEPDTQKHLPALLSHVIGSDGKAKGTQIIYLKPNDGVKADIPCPVRFVQGHDKEAYIPIQKGTSTDDRWFVALSIESAITIAKANPKLRVFCAASYENLVHPPFKGQDNALIICADKKDSLVKLKESAELLAAKGFDVYCATAHKAKDFNSLYQSAGSKAVAQQINAYQSLAKQNSKAAIDEQQQKTLIEVVKELACLEKELKQAKEKLPYAYQVQAKEALIKFVTSLRKDSILFKQLKRSYPNINKRLDLIIQSEQGKEL